MRGRILLFFATVSLLLAADPNFTGEWKLNPARSGRNNLPEPAAASLTIEHHGNTIKCSTGSDHAAAPAAAFSFTTDRKESRYRIGESSRSTIVKWEGDVLIINTIVNGRGPSYTVMDRWKLSRDGRTLKIERTVESVNGEAEGNLVYDRVD
ncbi:MAG TPA: hypothetical protein VFA04_03010 [Bryobacteraceae bacterium]|nr:hypothetical protein [Bryobacteraceae bacterium]